MPSTSIYGITYPASTDLVTNGATQMGTISTGVETAVQGQTKATFGGYRNQIENPTFSQNQRPAVATSVADFWTYYVDNIVGVTNTRNTLAPVAGVPEWVTYSLTNVVASNAGGVARYVANQQSIPEVRNLANSTVIVSFYAKASAGTPKIGVNLTQYFGTGGTPSTDVVVNGQAVTISTTWTRYSLTFTLASVVGKTFGTNDDSATILRLWYSAGTNFDTQSGSIGLQTSTIEVTGIQVEVNYLSPLEVRPSDRNWVFSSNWGQWIDFPAQIKQGAAAMTTTVNWARYTIVGKTCFVNLSLKAGANGTASQTIEVISSSTLPTPLYTGGIQGTALFDDIGTGFNFWAARLQPGTNSPRWTFYSDGGTTARTTPTIATNDGIHLFSYYEIA